LAKGLNRQELLSLARAGAEARIKELEGQIAAIRATFGDRKKGRPAAAAAAKPRKRRKMSKAGRAKIAAAAKARWAKWRADQKK
jgi:hypothetical protein